MSVNQIQPTIGTGAVGGSSTGYSERLVPELWAKEIAANRVDNLVLWMLIDGRYSGEISAKGDVLHIPFVGEIDDATDTNYTVGNDVSIDNLDVTTVDLIIDRYIRKGIGVQDALKAQSAYDLRAPGQQRLARYLDRAKDEEVFRKAVAGFSNTPIVASGTGGVLAFEDFVDAAAVLDAHNVPEDERYIVLNGYGRADLRKIPQFTAYKEVGESGLVKSKNGFVGEIYNMPVYVTNAIKANDDATPAYEFLMFHKSAIIGATQEVPRVEFGRDYKKGQDDMIGSELFGVKVLRPDHGVVIKRQVTPSEY